MARRVRLAPLDKNTRHHAIFSSIIPRVHTAVLHIHVDIVTIIVLAQDKGLRQSTSYLIQTGDVKLGCSGVSEGNSGHFYVDFYFVEYCSKYVDGRMVPSSSRRAPSLLELRHPHSRTGLARRRAAMSVEMFNLFMFNFIHLFIGYGLPSSLASCTCTCNCTVHRNDISQDVT